MSDFAKTLNDLAKLCGKSEYQLAQYSGLDPTVCSPVVRRGEARFEPDDHPPDDRAGGVPGSDPEVSGAGAVHPERPDQ